MRKMGFASGTNLSDQGAMAVINVAPQELDLAFQCKEKLIEEFKKLGFTYVSLDLKGMGGQTVVGQGGGTTGGTFEGDAARGQEKDAKGGISQQARHRVA